MTHALSSSAPEEHPLLKGKYALYTPPINEFFSTVCEWIDSHVTGGYVYGAPRQGKSRAVQFWIEQLLSERYAGLLPFFRMSYRSHDRFSESEFLTELLQASRHRFANSGTRLVKLNRFVKLYATRARNAGGNHVVLMIDEAQNMREQSYRTLCNLQNDLDDIGFQLTVISVGSHELAYQHSAFIQAGDLHLVGRFMVRDALFRGIRSATELAYVLKACDEQTEWPQGSGISYTRHFFPRAFDIGFRIADLAPQLWTLFVELAPPKMTAHLNVAMEHVAKPIECLFRELSTDAASVPISRETLRRVVEQVRYPTYMRALAQLRPVTSDAK